MQQKQIGETLRSVLLRLMYSIENPFLKCGFEKVNVY
jgi:hypothetical protein